MAAQLDVEGGVTGACHVSDESGDDLLLNALVSKLDQKKVAYILDSCQEFDEDLTLASLMQYPHRHLLQLLDEINESYDAGRKRIPIHHINKFAQILTDNHPVPPQRIVLSEVEETAMSNAKLEMDKIERQTTTIRKRVAGTKQQYQATQTVVNDTFDAVVNALRKRQQQILSKLERIQTAKLQIFDRQILNCKTYQKEYNDMHAKWEKMMNDVAMDRRERKKQIESDAISLQKKSESVQVENDKIMNLVKPEFLVRFGEYDGFVSTFGNINSSLPTPIMSTQDILSTKATLDITFDEDDMDDENRGYKYVVEWKQAHPSSDDDEKCDWQTKNYDASPVEISGLDANTKYVVKCVAKVDELCSDSSPIHCLRTGAYKTFQVRRGDITASINWQYHNNSVDALSFSVNKDIVLFGIAVFDGKGTITVQYKFFKGDNAEGNKNDAHIIAESEKHSFTRNEASVTPIRVDLKQPVSIKADQKYTIQLLQKNEGSFFGSRSFCITKGQSKIETGTHGITIEFFDASYSPNGTGPTRGVIPIRTVVVKQLFVSIRFYHVL